jgi:uncharacterized protein (DUF924 family)/ribosomal protein S27AE
MEQGRLSRDEFMSHIVEQTREVMVERIKTGEFADPDFGTLKTPCPRCGAKIHEGYKHFACEKCDYKLWKVVASRQWETAEMDELLSKRVIGPLQGFRSKMGRAFAAIIKLKDDHTPEFDFGQSDADADAEEVDFSARKPSAPAPSAATASSSTAWPMSAKRAWARAGPAISAPARSSCSRKSAAPTCRSCSPPAAPTCSRASSRTRRGASFRPSWCAIQDRQGRLRVRAAGAQGGAQGRGQGRRQDRAGGERAGAEKGRREEAGGQEDRGSRRKSALATRRKKRREESGGEKAGGKEGRLPRKPDGWTRRRHPRRPRFLVPAGRHLSPGVVPQGRAFDAAIRERFGAAVEAALAGTAAAAVRDDAEMLARILLLDQFTRNIHRGTPRAFAGDAQALMLATELVASGRDKNLDPWQRWFAYLPFEHSRIAARAGTLGGAVHGAGTRNASRGFRQRPRLRLRHREVIARFGRFPHRNAILGRESTAEESRFLAQPGSSF